MVSNQAHIDYGAMQHLVSLTENSQRDQNGASVAHSQRNSETVQGGLLGSPQAAAFSVGQNRDDQWRKVADHNQLLVDNNNQLLSVYQGGQDAAQSVLAAPDYGTASVINPT
ncbi:hypothetical protein ACWEV3_33805 [Saccharopolyspora sp. NPDC003752]